MRMLGVFENIYGVSAEMDFSQTLLISIVGFSIVFLVLGFLAIFVYAMGKVFDVMQKKAEAKKAAELTAAPEISPAPVSSEGTPLPSNQSIGDLTLIGTSEEEAAVIMAVTSAKSGIPLNRLKFNTIKCLEDNE